MSNNQITEIITIGIAIAFMILIVLIAVLIMIVLKQKQRKKQVQETTSGENIHTKNSSVIEQTYDKRSIFDFMEFDKIEDNMIIQNNGMKYLMVIGCQGVNYDLLSRNEKISIEQGFAQFLNTLRHSVQLYIQTRTINMEKSVINYKNRLKEYEDKLNKMKIEYKKMVESGKYRKEELNRYIFEITKQTNLCEYGKDLISNTERMSLNRKVLTKQYYIIVPYNALDIGNSNLDKEELKNISFSDLYTMSQAIIRTLAICGINSKILNSEELTELLYIAYNRDEEEVFGLDKAKKAGYEELYSTAKDVLDKKIEALNEKIEKEARALANLKILEAKNDKELEIEKKEDNLEMLIKDLAKTIIKDNSQFLGEEISQAAIEKIENIEETKGGNTKNVENKETKTRTKRGRTKKSE